LATFAGCYATYDVGSVCNHLFRVESSFFTRETLYDDSGVLID
jgi:hypothetical protein